MRRILPLLIALLFSASIVMAAFTPTLCWSFDTDSATIAEDCEGTGTYVVNTIRSDYTASGKFGGARDYEYSNTDYDDVNTSTKIALTGNAVSIGAWLKEESYPGAGAYNHYIISSARSGNWVTLGDKETQNVFACWFNGVAGVQDTVAFDLAQWYHVVCVWDGTNLSLYVNGSLRVSAARTYTVDSALNGIGFGWTNPSRYDGIVDEAFLHNGSMTQANVTDVYDRTTSWAPPAVAPVVTLINFTSDAPPEKTCTYPTICANTTDTTPTFELATDINAACRIGTTDIGYTSMVNDCTQDGAYNTSHSCTQPTALGVNNYTFYFACNSSTGDANTAPLASAHKATLNITAPPPNVAPNSSLNAPANNTQFNNSGAVRLNFTATDDRNTSFPCTINYNGTLFTNTSVLNNTQTVLAVDLSWGKRTWLVNCSDSNSTPMANSSVNYTFYINDTAAPLITLLSPANMTQFNDTSTATFNWSATDGKDGTFSCTLNNNGTLTTNTTTNNTQTLQTLNTLTFGRRTWSVNCTDSTGNAGSNGTFTYFLNNTATPKVSLLTPLNNTQYNNTPTTTFNYSVVDAQYGTIGCTVQVNGTNTTNLSVLNNTQTLLTSTLNYGLTTWLVNCTNIAGLTGNNGTYNVYVNDTLAPQISLSSPSNGTSYNINATSPTVNVTLCWIANDSRDTSFNCYLFINGAGTSNTSNTTTNNTETCTRLNNTQQGTYNWNINCTDAYGNQGGSVGFTFTVTQVIKAVINFGTGIYSAIFSPNMTTALYAWVRNANGIIIGVSNITSQNNSAMNQSSIAPLFNVTTYNATANPVVIRMNLSNVSGGSARMKCGPQFNITNTTILTNNSQTIATFNQNTTNGIFCFLSYENATQRFNFSINIKED